MCIIIDENVSSYFFLDQHKKDTKPILDWLEHKKGKLVYGGKLAKELNVSKKFRSLLATFGRAGIAISDK